jgi:hypothetical protein
MKALFGALISNDPTLADAILDRVVHCSHKIELKGTRSMRDGEAVAAT